MKYLAFLFILLPNFISAQDCTLKNEKDRFNQDPRLTTGFISLGAGNDKFLLSISADKKEVDYFFAMDNSAMCFNDYSRVIVTFVTKQKGNFKNGGTTNCKGYFHFIFSNQENIPYSRCMDQFVAFSRIALAYFLVAKCSLLYILDVVLYIGSVRLLFRYRRG